VTDPVETNILKSTTEATGTNVTGFYTIPPVKRNIDTFLAIKPGIKTIGTIYNSGETNSVTLNKRAKAEAEKHGIKWVEVTVTSSAEIKNAAESMVGKVDAFVTPQDNTVASAYEALIKVARENKIPWFSLDVLAVERGAIAAVAQHQYQNGVDWAKKVAIPVLLGKDPGTVVPVAAEVFEMRVNTAAAKAVGITIPEAIVKQADKVFDK
jgi:putative ABC transport system substrate-binding protein